MAELHLRFPERLGLGLLLDPDAAVEVEHQVLGRLVGNFPEARDHGTGAGHVQGALQGCHALARAALAYVRVARGEDRKLAVGEVER